MVRRDAPRSPLQAELSQSKPFENPEVETYLNVLRTHDRLNGDFFRFLKKNGVSQPQYNALRILRGAGATGLPSLEVGHRMVARVPDITRLLDRLAAKGWIRRIRSKEDGRVVIARITPKGRKLVDRLDEPVAAFHKRLLGHLTRQELERLNELLVKARDAG